MTNLYLEEATQRAVSAVEPVAIGNFREAYYTEDDMRRMFRAGHETAIKWREGYSYENYHYLVHDGEYLYIAKKRYDEERDEFYFEESHHGERINVVELIDIPGFKGQEKFYYKKKETTK
jgi:hypothetical protein